MRQRSTERAGFSGLLGSLTTITSRPYLVGLVRVGRIGTARPSNSSRDLFSHPLSIAVKEKHPQPATTERRPLVIPLTAPLVMPRRG